MNDNQIEALLEDYLAEWELAREEGRELTPNDLCADHPSLLPLLKKRLAKLKASSWMLHDPANIQSDADGRHSNDAGAADNQLTLVDFLASLGEGGVLSDSQLEIVHECVENQEASTAEMLAKRLIGRGVLTEYQADVLLNRESKPLRLDRYIILDAIGSGGMGIVFKALHRSMERVVAIKMLPEFAVNSPKKVERFHREARSVARITHPNVVTAFDAHEYDGTHFLVMEYVDGDNLHDLVNASGPLSVDDALNVVDQVAAGLGAAHALKMVHRDVKPTNIMLANDGTAKLLDLGLARTIQSSLPADDPELTRDGVGMGTVSFMSPEQAMDAKSADGRSDIYSLGCTLFYLLTGRAPFDRDTIVQTIVAHREVAPPPLGTERDDIPESVERLFQNMVAKSPDARYQTVQELQRDLASIAIADPAGIQPLPSHDAKKSASVSDSNTKPRPTWRRSKWIATVAVCTAGLAALVHWSGLASPSADASTMHREVAQWALTSGGYVTIEDDTQRRDVETTLDLPESDFRVVSLELYAETETSSMQPALKIPELESLTLAGYEQLDLADVDQLRSLKDLTFLNCSVTDPDIKSIAKLENLSTLTLEDCDITDTGIEWLAPLKNLKVLNVGGTFVTNEGLRLLKSLPQLTSLDLVGLDILAEDLRLLPPQLVSLSLRWCLVGDEVIPELKRFQNLDSLDLQGTEISSAGIEAMTELENLRELDLSDVTLSVEAITALGNLPGLSTLHLSGVNLRSKRGKALLNLKQISDLTLTESTLDDEGLMQLASLDNLVTLAIEATNVTPQAVARFQRDRSDVVLYADY